MQGKGITELCFLVPVGRETEMHLFFNSCLTILIQRDLKRSLLAPKWLACLYSNHMEHLHST